MPASETLSDADARGIVQSALRRRAWDGQRVLLVVPDHTRTAPVPLVFHAIDDAIGDRVARLDVLIALGTHPPLSEARCRERVGLTEASPRTTFFNHDWDNPEALRDIGTLDTASGPVVVRINRRIFDYDHLIVIGPVFPHEVAGFSGGNKYFFPGIAGRELIDMFHWLGALITNPEINGRIRTPVRDVIDRAAQLVTVPHTFVHLVVKGRDLHGVVVGDGGRDWETAARLSEQVNVRYVPRRFETVLGVVPPRYEDIWTAGKAVYKSEPVVADGGEVIVFAPHIREVSVTHGEAIEQVGYHVRDYFTAQADRFAHVPGTIRAHSTHVRGIGTYVDGVERPRIQVTLATAIPRETCARINLGWRDPATIRVDDFEGREDVLVIHDAGEQLYRLGPR